MRDEEREWFERIESERGYIRASLRITPTEHGGRETPLRTGYRASWYFGEREDGMTVVHDAPITVEGADWLAPGDEAIVRLHPIVPELWPDARPGVEIAMREGVKEVGRAVVIEAVPPAA